MLYKGQKISGPNEAFIVIPRQDQDIVFKAQAVLDYDDFEKMLPRPEAPYIKYANGTEGRDLTDTDYIKKRDDWAGKKTLYLILKSLEASTDLQWETVKMNDSETWKNWSTELKASGFNVAEIDKIVGTVMRANSLDEAMLEEAKKRFLATKQAGK